MSNVQLPAAGQCKWVEGTGGDYTFPCRNRVAAGVSYCDAHRAMVYISPEERRRSREGTPSFVPGVRRIAA